MLYSIELSEWLTIAAIILGPIAAVQAQKFLEGWREKKNRKLEIFKTLMATRAARLDPAHVTALNQIDLEFSPKKKNEQLVIAAWEKLMDCFASVPAPPAAEADETEQQNYSGRLERWAETRENYLIDLLDAMSNCLGFKFGHVKLKKGIYYPQAYTDLEQEQRLLRQFLLASFSGRLPLQMEVVSFPQAEPTDEQKEINQLTRKYLKGEIAIPVIMNAADTVQSDQTQ